MKVQIESEVAQSCLILSDSMDCSLPGFSVHGISQARALEWGAIGFSAVNCSSINIGSFRVCMFWGADLHYFTGK